MLDKDYWDFPESDKWLTEIRDQIPNHPSTEDCPDMECAICSVRDCPQGDPLHYHHDGCPCCSFLIKGEK